MLKVSVLKPILLQIALMASAPIWAWNVDGIEYANTEGKTTAKVVSGGSYTGTVNIPSTVFYNGVTYTVESIGYNAFSNCTFLTKVTIPESVTNIEFDAFSNCKRLTELTLSNSVKYISWNAFSGCTSLTELTIPGSVVSISNNAFSGCSSLKSVRLDDSKETSLILYASAFENTPIETLYVGRNIDGQPFKDKTSILSLTISNSVDKIGQNAFSGCTGLSEVTIPGSVTKIDDYAFSGCAGLKTVTLADGEKTLKFAATAFDNAPIETLYLGRSISGMRFPYVTSLTIGSLVKSFGESAFSGCTGLSEVTIPNSVTSIGAYAFSGCTGLSEVTIPNSVTSIGAYAFSGCTGIT